MSEKGYIGKIPNASAQAPDHSPLRKRQDSLPPLRLLSGRDPLTLGSRPGTGLRVGRCEIRIWQERRKPLCRRRVTSGRSPTAEIWT